MCFFCLLFELFFCCCLITIAYGYKWFQIEQTQVALPWFLLQIRNNTYATHGIFPICMITIHHFILNISSSYLFSWSSFASTSDSSEPEIALPSPADFFTLSLHSSNGRRLLVVMCCARELSVAFTNGGYSHWLRKFLTHCKLLSSHCGWGSLWFIFSQLQLNSDHDP